MFMLLIGSLNWVIGWMVIIGFILADNGVTWPVLLAWMAINIYCYYCLDCWQENIRWHQPAGQFPKACMVWLLTIGGVLPGLAMAARFSREGIFREADRLKAIAEMTPDWPRPSPAPNRRFTVQSAERRSRNLDETSDELIARMQKRAPKPPSH